MTSTAKETPSELPTLRVASIRDDKLAQMTLGFLRECLLRLEESGYQNAEMRRVAEALAAPHKRTGHVTLELVPEPMAFDVNTGQQLDPSVVPAELRVSRSFGSLAIEDLYHGQVVSLRCPAPMFVYRQTDPARLELAPESAKAMASVIGAQLAAGLQAMPAPVVENTVNVEPAPVQLLEADDTGLDINFKRDSTGRITSAHAEPAN
jgi:hypothetical protein